MSQPFDASYFPPAPVLEVSLAFPDDPPSVGPITAFVDTGADGTFIPLAYLKALKVERSDQTAVQPFFGSPRLADVYMIDLFFGDSRMTAIEVVANEENDEIVLGRNVLNKLMLLLDGPHALTDILEKRPGLR